MLIRPVLSGPSEELSDLTPLTFKIELSIVEFSQGPDNYNKVIFVYVLV